MKTSQILNSATLLRVALETTEGVPVVLSNQPYLPLSGVTETSDNPITLDPIATSPTERAFVSYQTDSGRGATAKGYLFSALNFIGRQITGNMASAYITNAGGATNIALTSGATFILAGVTATAKVTASVTMANFIESFYAYWVDGTASSTNFDFTETPSENFDLFVGYPAGSPAYMLFVAKDPLYVGSAPTLTGTTTVTFDRSATTGSGNQINVPELYPVFVAAGMAPTFVLTLGLPDTIDALFDAAFAFHADQNTERDAALALTNTMQNLITALRRLPIGTEGLAALTDLAALVLASEQNLIASYHSSGSIYKNLVFGKQKFSSYLAQGKYLEATEAVKTYAGASDGLGYVELITVLRNGKSLTINGRTFTNTTGVTMTSAQVADKFRTNTDLTGTITTTYSFGTRLDTDQISVTKTGSQASWEITWSSTQTDFKLTIVPPLVTVYETSAARAAIVVALAALTNSNPVAKAAFEALQAELESVWGNLSARMVTRDTLYTRIAATGALLDDLAALVIDATFLPNKLTPVYDRMIVSDTGIGDLSRLSGELVQFNERGTIKKVTAFIRALVTTLDLSIKANEPPQLNFTFAGNPGDVSVAEGNVIGFTSARLKTMPQMSGDNVTFCSLVLEDASFVNQNILLQEFSLPNMAGIKADREVLATEAHHKVSTESVGRKATFIVIDGDTTDTDGGLSLDYKTLLNQPVKFKLQCGNLQGLKYIVDLRGVLTNESPSSSQANSAERTLEVTVKSFTLTLL
jgi:hypothetical protein